MRELIAWDMVSLDGYFETVDRQLDWFAFDEQIERYILDTQVDAGTVLFGRRTYEMMRDYWPTAEGPIADFMNSVAKVVVSTTMDDPGWSNVTLVRAAVPDAVAELKRAPGGPIFVFGSAVLTDTLIRHDLIDEYRIGVNPVLLGDGHPFFRVGLPRRALRLTDHHRFDSGLMVLHYRRA